MNSIEDLKVLDELYAPFHAILSAREDAEKTVKERFEVRETYANPFSIGYELMNAVRSIRMNLVTFSIRSITCPYPNLNVNELEVVKHLNEKVGEYGFDSKVIHDFISERYLNDADAVSLQEIKRKAKNRLPVIWENGNRKVLTPEDIVRGEKLEFRWWIDWSFSDKWGGKPSLNYDVLDEITAIERLAAVVLNGASPSQTNGGRIADVYRNAQTKEELLRKHLIGGTIRSVKLYKNGRFEIEFGNHEEAKRVAAMIS